MRHIGENVVRIEAAALKALADRLAGPMAKAFEQAVEMLYGCGGRVVVTGMGKSGLVARKVAATLSSTGTPALFLHPAEAVHGDLGMLVRGDVVAGAIFQRRDGGDRRLAADHQAPGAGADRHDGDSLSGKAKLSTLAQAADVALDCSVAQEACSLGLAPTASTTTMLALGDALALVLAEKRGFKEEDFADLHPGASWARSWRGWGR